jgi:hypothetical protein
MGLDLVEWLMAVEERFQLHIPDERAAKMKTLGDAVDVVAETWSRQTSGFCASQRVFHQLRGVSRQPRRRVRPEHSIHEALAGVELRAMAQALALRLPFAAPGWLLPAQAGALTIGAMVGLAHGGWPALPLAAAGVGLAALASSRAEELPRTTMGEFVGATVRLNAGRLLARGARWNRTDAVASIFEATRAQFGDIELSEATRLVDLSPDG